MTLSFKIPTTWNEMSERQRADISSTISKAKPGDKGVYFKIIYQLFCPAKTFSITGLRERYRFVRLLNEVPLRVLYPLAEFVFEKLDLTRFPKSVKIDGVTYYGPADRLSNISIEELNFTYRFYFDWIVKKDKIALDRLVTTLYRPAKKKRKGDIREDFDMEIIQTRGSILPRMPEEIKTAIGFAYKGSVEYMFSRYPIIFPPQKKQKEKSEDPAKPIKYSSFIPMINAMFMGENQPFGSRKDTVKTNAYIFFDVAQETIKANREREKNAQKRK